MKKQVIGWIVLAFFVPQLICVETPIDKHFRKQIYENKVALTAENKKRAVQIISDHVKKCQTKLESEQSFFEKARAPFLFLLGLGTFSLGICFLKLDITLGKLLEDTQQDAELKKFNDGARYRYGEYASIFLTGMASFGLAYFAESQRRESVQKLTHYLARDNKVLEKLKINSSV